MTIEIKNITKTFLERSWRTAFLRKTPKKVRALQDVSLTIGPGEVLGLLGPNGAGKTTWIKILATLIIPDSGTATVCGHDLLQQPQQVRRHVGLVNTSERSFYWRLTGKQNLEFFASLWGFSKSGAKSRVAELLEMAGLKEKANTAVMNYSSGLQQRLAVARALLADPRILLLDEPTRSLDPVAATELRNFSKTRLAGELGKTIIWCTHNLKEASDICDRLAIINKGRLAASGSVKEIQSIMAAESAYRFKVDQWKPELADVQNWPPTKIIRNNGFIELELKTGEDQVPTLLGQMVNAGINVYFCTRQDPDLEEAFEHLVK
jgi:ABC-2 type transport system ATP-binding protein